jgi:mannose-1-phosphate guanylyltransferase
MIYPVMLAGGTGSRLSPLSRQLNPKQFLKLTDPKWSMLQSTVARLNGLPMQPPLIICMWNSSMFMSRAGSYLEKLGKHRPDILAACEAAIENVSQDFDFTRVDEARFAECANESVDYAVMEKTDAAAVVALDAGWSDIGSWSALWEVSSKDSHGNSTSSDVMTRNINNTLVRAESRLLATLGVDDIVRYEDTYGRT